MCPFLSDLARIAAAPPYTPRASPCAYQTIPDEISFYSPLNVLLRCCLVLLENKTSVQSLVGMQETREIDSNMIVATVRSSSSSTHVPMNAEKLLIAPLSPSPPSFTLLLPVTSKVPRNDSSKVPQFLELKWSVFDVSKVTSANLDVVGIVAPKIYTPCRLPPRATHFNPYSTSRCITF
jgi:hypothetical protein